jgi:hypothetical protein
LVIVYNIRQQFLAIRVTNFKKKSERCTFESSLAARTIYEKLFFKNEKPQTENTMGIIQKFSTKYSSKIAILLTALLIGLVVVIGVITQQPVPAWWFVFTPVLLRMLKG